MSDPSASDSDPAPRKEDPPQIPRPHMIDPRAVGPTYGSAMEVGKTGEGEPKHSHPTDSFQPLKERTGCGGGCACLGATLLVAVLFVAGLIVALFYFGPGRYVAQGYTVVNLGDEEAFVDIAPEKPTLYIGRIVTYRASVTIEPVAIFAQEIVVSGNFFGNVSLTGAKVTTTEKARFARDLEVYAIAFLDRGSTLNGNRTGRVLEEN